MNAIRAPLPFLARHATRALAIGVLLGLAVPPLADLLRPALVPVIFANLILALLRLDFSEVATHLRRPAVIIAFTVFSLVVSPVLMWLVLAPLGLPDGLKTGLILMAAGPPITSAPAFALIMGLDAAFAIAAVLATHVLLPLTLPPLALWLLGIELDIGLIEFMRRLALLIGSSFVIAALLKRLLPAAFLRRHAVEIDGLAVLGLVIFAVAIMSGVTAFFFDRPGFVVLTILVAFAANALLQLLGAVVFQRAGRLVAFTAGHMTGNCNMGLILAVLADRAELDVVVFFALAQLPMYMLPGVAVPVYRHFLRPGG